MRVEVVVIQAHGGNKTCWDYVVEHLTADDAVLVIDETGFLKQGRTSCGALLGVNANHWFGAWNTTPLIAGEAKDIAQELPAEAWQRLDASSDGSPSMVDSFGPQSPRQRLEDLGHWGGDFKCQQKHQRLWRRTRLARSRASPAWIASSSACSFSGLVRNSMAPDFIA